MPTYAQATKVNSEASRAEIERTLVRFGATAFSYGWDQEVAVIGFRLKGRVIRFKLPMPSRADKAITHTPEKGWLREPKAQEAAYEQAVRQRWRALALCIKAKLEAVEAGIVSVEEEFLAQTMLSDGSTVGEWVGPQVDEVYRTGGMPALLPGASQKALTDGVH
jgi:hypothetical protein